MYTNEDTDDIRRFLWDNGGFRPVPVYNPDAPVKNPGKRPKGAGWIDEARQTPPGSLGSAAENDALNTGILCDGMRAIDIDVDAPGVAAQVRDLAVEMLGAAPERFRMNSERVLLLYKAAVGEPGKRVKKGANGDKIEVLGRGQQFVAFWKHPSGSDLNWRHGVPGDVGLQALTPVA
jgi:hypothetical protein